MAICLFQGGVTMDLQEYGSDSLQVWGRRASWRPQPPYWPPAHPGLRPPRHWHLSRSIPGRFVTKGDPDYERWRTAMPWQLYKAPRYPDVIVRPSHSEVVAVVKGPCGVVDAWPLNLAATMSARHSCETAVCCSISANSSNSKR